MGKAEIIIAGILFFSLAITAFLLTLIEFVNMDKAPDKYKNPRYKKKSTIKKTTSKRSVTSKKTDSSASPKRTIKKAISKAKPIKKKATTTTTKKTVKSTKAKPTKTVFVPFKDKMKMKIAKRKIKMNKLLNKLRYIFH